MPKLFDEPFREGYLPVSGDHSLYFADHGYLERDAVLVLHGGPGSGCKDSMLDWFDRARQRVVLFDQRGAGRSRPSGATRENDTWRLVDDIEQLRRHLGIRSWTVVGGSWGATLALCYAGRHPEAVRGLVLRGVFLAGRNEVDWMFQGLRSFAPAAWAGLTAGWNAPQRQRVFQTLTAKLQSVSAEEQQDAARRWGEYEEALMRMMSGEPAGVTEPDAGWLQKYRIQAHYLAQSCFISQPALFRCARKLAEIPVILVHGTHDWICPPANATRLSRFMPHADLRWVMKGGHAASDPLIREALRRAIADMQAIQRP